jgi:hypothetical protein
MRRPTLRIGASILILLGAGFVRQALACTCGEPAPPCQAYWESPVVFVGSPLSVSKAEVDSRGHKVAQRLFRFQVQEAFRGATGSELDVITGFGGGDCGYDFRPQMKYLVYAYRQEDRIYTNICTRTRAFADASEDLSYIRSISSLQSGGSIYGTAKLYAVDLESGGWNPAGPIAGALVAASSGDHTFVAVTNGDGHYAFSKLRPGKYTVRVTLPAKLSPVEEKTVNVSDRGCAEINYTTVTDGRIVGRLLDQQGRPLAIKTVNLLPSNRAGKSLRPLWAITDKDGVFQFTNLPPGQYVLGIRITDAPDEKLPYAKTFYPSTTEQAKATVLSVGEGEHLAGIDFRLG